MKISTTPKLSDQELLETFPESEEIVTRNIARYKQQRKSLVAKIRGQMIKIRKIKSKFARWFCHEWLKINEGADLLSLDKLISHYDKFLAVASGRYRKSKSWIEQIDIDHALAVPLPEIAEPYVQKLKRTGKNWVGLCPFHNEKHPSFIIFRDNKFKCFGCGEYGNAINFIQKTQGLSFIETIKYILNK